MNALRKLRLEMQMVYARMGQKEQWQFIILSSCIAAVLLLLIAYVLVNNLAWQKRLVSSRIDQLRQVMILQGEYKAKQRERADQLKNLAQNPVRLVAWVENAAKASGVEVGQLRPEDGEVSSEDGIIESKVDLRASGLSVDRLEDFLNRLEQGPGVVVVRRLKISRPYRKDVADIELTVTTFKLKGA